MRFGTRKASTRTIIKVRTVERNSVGDCRATLILYLDIIINNVIQIVRQIREDESKSYTSPVVITGAVNCMERRGRDSKVSRAKLAIISGHLLG